MCAGIYTNPVLVLVLNWTKKKSCDFNFFRSRLREMEEKLAMLQKENQDKENNPVNHTCSGCGQLRQDLDVTLRVLNDQSCAKYGDLLRNNFTLTHKVK